MSWVKVQKSRKKIFDYKVCLFITCLSSFLLNTHIFLISRQVTDLVLGNAEQYTLWDCIQHLLTNHERERYELLRQIWTDRGRARAWLRSAINERSLERYMTGLINSTNIGTFYEDWSFLLNQESSSILPNMAAGKMDFLLLFCSHSLLIVSKLIC